ncbi:MAG TPA: CHAT domain-containing protein [Thermoanaerobaculia bacterium]
MTKLVCRPASFARMSSNGILAPLTLCLAACILACGHLPPLRSRPADTLEAPPTPPPLPPAPAAKPADQRELRLTLPAGTYVRLVIVSTPMDLAVRQVGPEGQQLEEVQLAGGAAEPTRLSWVVTTAGEFRWTVEPRGLQGLAGSAAIALEEQRQAEPCDEARLRVERAVVGAQWEMSRPGNEAPEGVRARALIEPVVAVASKVGELEEVLAVLLERARATRREGSGDASKLLQRVVQLARTLGDGQAEAKGLEEQAQLLPTIQAMGILRSVLALERAPGDDSGQAGTLFLLGYYHNVHGDAEQALQSYQDALELQLRAGDPHGLPWTYGELGVLYGYHGDTNHARDYLDLALELGQEAGDLEAQGFALEGQARFDIDLGDLQAAYDEYNRARKLLAPAGASALAAWAVDGLARVLLYLGEPERARQSYGEALSDFDILHVSEGSVDALLGIGSALEAEGMGPRALGYFTKALGIVRRDGLRTIEGVALYDLGRLHRELGQPAEAIPELETALALEAGHGPVRLAQYEIELAKSYSQVGKLPVAEAAFQRAIQLSGRAPAVEAAALAGLSRVLRDQGDLVTARTMVERALDLTEAIRSGVIRPDQRVSFLASRRAYYELYIDLLIKLHQLQPDAGHDTEAVAASERARARGLLDLLVQDPAELRYGVPVEQQEREAEIGQRIARLQMRLTSSEDLALSETELQRVEHSLTQAEDEEKDLEAEIRRRQPGYAAVRTPRPLPLHEIQGLLDERTALLEFFVGEESSYLFLITRRGLGVYLLPDRRTLVDRVGRVRSALNQESRLRFSHFAADSYELYRILLQPAVDTLRGSTRLIVAPDGPLYSLSFEALLTGRVAGAGSARRDLPYLIRDRAISYVPSASVLAQLVVQPRQGGDTGEAGKLFVGFGDPGEAVPPDRGCSADPSNGSGPPAGGALVGGWGDERVQPGSERSRSLPAARAEVCRIGRLFPAGQAVVFTGHEATEEHVKTNPLVTSARILHFATHGVLDERNPDSSGLRLAHASGSTEDGLLQVREISNLELHADLVVLSACKTGLGKEVSGEGLIGMTRAFFHAGAGSIVVSLWQVDDEATADLMVSFYHHLLETGDKSEALRRAKLEFIDHSRYFHPYFWAAFIMEGRP